MLDTVVKGDPKQECDGLMFRFSSSAYTSKYGSIEIRKSLRLLKRKSCPGCSSCCGIQDYINEDVIIADSGDYLDHLVDGQTYKAHIDYSYDAQNGEHDSELTFIRVG